MLVRLSTRAVSLWDPAMTANLGYLDVFSALEGWVEAAHCGSGCQLCKHIDLVHGIIRKAGGEGVRNQCVVVGCSTAALGRVAADEQDCSQGDARKDFKTHSSVYPVPVVWSHADSNSASQWGSCKSSK